MDMAADIVTWACVIAGSVMALIGAVGMIRLPDVFQRMHAAGGAHCCWKHARRKSVHVCVRAHGAGAL